MEFYVWSFGWCQRQWSILTCQRHGNKYKSCVQIWARTRIVPCANLVRTKLLHAPYSHIRHSFLLISKKKKLGLIEFESSWMKKKRRKRLAFPTHLPQAQSIITYGFRTHLHCRWSGRKFRWAVLHLDKTASSHELLHGIGSDPCDRMDACKRGSHVEQNCIISRGLERSKASFVCNSACIANSPQPARNKVPVNLLPLEA